MQKSTHSEIEKLIEVAARASVAEQSRLAAMEAAINHNSSAWTRWHAKHVIGRYIRRHRSAWDEIEHKIPDLPYGNPLAVTAIHHAAMAIFAREHIQEQDFILFSLSYQLVFGPCEGTNNAG
jgi:hypothetical protein